MLVGMRVHVPFGKALPDPRIVLGLGVPVDEEVVIRIWKEIVNCSILLLS